MLQKKRWANAQFFWKSETSVVRNGKFENYGKCFRSNPESATRPEPPLVKDEGAAELWLPAPGSRITALHWAAGCGRSRDGPATFVCTDDCSHSDKCTSINNHTE